MQLTPEACPPALLSALWCACYSGTPTPLLLQQCDTCQPPCSAEPAPRHQGSEPAAASALVAIQAPATGGACAPQRPGPLPLNPPLVPVWMQSAPACVCVCIHSCVCVCACVRACVCIHTYMHISTYVRTDTHADVEAIRSCAPIMNVHAGTQVIGRARNGRNHSKQVIRAHVWTSQRLEGGTP